MISITNILRLNWCATIAINHHIGGLKAVLHMPVKVYGPLKYNIKGRIILPNDAVRGMLEIGSEHEDYTTASGKAEMNINGQWRINGIVRIGPDSFIGVGKDGVLEMNDGSFFGRDTQIHCSNDIRFGKNVFAGEMYVTDSTEHQIITEGKEQPMTGSVHVGDGTYLGFRTILLKGCNIPPCSVVASAAVCNKDYTLEGSEQLMLAGVPASVRRKGVSALK